MSDSTLPDLYAAADKLMRIAEAAEGPKVGVSPAFYIALEKVCQKVAREARLDELELVRIKSGYYKKRSHYVRNIYLPLDYLETRHSELTQKPAEETEGQ